MVYGIPLVHFCNAGFDLCGSTSLVAYNTNPIINFIVPFEIIMGGARFYCSIDIHDKYIKEKEDRQAFHGIIFLSFALHTKIVLMMTVSLVVIGTLLFLIMEFTNPATIGKMNLGDKHLYHSSNQSLHVLLDSQQWICIHLIELQKY